MNTITGRSAFLSLLEDEGVAHLFGNPGTTELPVMDALKDHPQIEYVMGMQESVVVGMADGYGRASGKLAACNVHVAPGLGNAMGALYNANWYGSPVLITAGQQEQGHGLMEPLLYGPLVAMATPLVKWAVEVTRLEDLPRIVRRAAKLALTPPTGPVFISLPGDILNTQAALELGHATRVDAATRPTARAVDALATRILQAKNPVIIAGHEVATSNALNEAAHFAELLGAPVYQQTVPYGAHFLSEQPTFMGALSRDQSEVRAVLEPYDLLICLGADVLRMSVFSTVDPLPRDLRIAQIGLRDWEIGKNYPTETAVRADVKETLLDLNTVLAQKQSSGDRVLAQSRLSTIAKVNWTTTRDALRTRLIGEENVAPIDPDQLMLHLVDALPADAIVVEEAISSARALLRLRPFRGPNDYFGLASGGIGFAAAGVIGVHLAHPTRPIVAIIGDGSAMYSIQALWTAANMKLPIVYVITNNRSYRILKERLVAFHGNDNFIGMDLTDPAIDFVGLAQSMGVKAERITDVEGVRPALVRALNASGPSLLEVIVADGFAHKKP
jgi:benzoylformate decarboxylase